jgi:nucleoid-associated protein YgaU
LIQPAKDSAGVGTLFRDDAVTRESKLALIIAVTLVLLVGVLLSDHLSGATEAEFDQPVAPAKAATPVAVLPGAGDPLPTIVARPATQPEVVPPGMDPGLLPIEPVVITQGAEPAPPAGGDLIRNALDGATVAVQGTIDALRQNEAPVLAGFVRVDPSTVTVVTESDAARPPVKPVAEPERLLVPVVTRTAVPASEVSWKTHTVVSGDNLYRLAAKYLGDGDRWPELQKINADQLGGEETVQIGMVLRIAPQATARTISTTTARSEPSRRDASPTRTYVVLKGDMLSTISQKLLGTTRRMNEIVELNGLKDPDDVRVGQTLKIPAR